MSGGDETSSMSSTVKSTTTAKLSASRAELGTARIRSSMSSKSKSGEGERILSMISRADGPQVTAGPLTLSSENLISVFLPRPGGLKTRELEAAAEALNWEVVRTAFLRGSGNKVSRAFRTDFPEVAWMTRENPSLLDDLVFSGSVLGFGAAFDFGGGGGFFSPSRQLQPIK